MSKKSKEQKIIKDYYKKAYKLIGKDKKSEAVHLLYVEMPLDLYDKSLDILDNRNEKKDISESLILLIEDVTRSLNNSIYETGDTLYIETGLEQEILEEFNHQY